MTPLILALDTTRECGSLALARGAEALEEVALHAPEGFAHVIYGQIQSLLERHQLAVCEVDCFAAASGPGSFTGVRVGLACIKGLAHACAKPAAAVSNLAALASFGTAPLRAAVMDARRGEIYGGLYNAQGEAVRPEMVAPLAVWLDTLPPEVQFVTLDFPLDLTGTRFQGAGVIAAANPVAGAIARIAFERWQRGQVFDPAGLDANYVRRSDAELFWKD